MKSLTSVQKLFALGMLLLIIVYFLNMLVIPFAVPYLDFFTFIYGEDTLVNFKPDISYAAAFALTLKSVLNIIVAVYIFKQAKKKEERPLTWAAFALFYGVFAPIALYLKVMAKELHTFRTNPSQITTQKQEYSFPGVSIPEIRSVAALLLIIALLSTQLGEEAHKIHEFWFNFEGAIQVVNYKIVETATTLNALVLVGYLNILAAIWVFKEAGRHKENTVTWAFLTLFFGIFAITALYLVILAKELRSSKISFHNPALELEQIENVENQEEL